MYRKTEKKFTMQLKRKRDQCDEQQYETRQDDNDKILKSNTISDLVASSDRKVQRLCDEGLAEKSKKGCDPDSAVDLGCIEEHAVNLANITDCSDKEIDSEESDIINEDEKTVSSRLNIPDARVVLTKLRGIEDYVKSGNIMDLVRAKKSKKGCEAESALDLGCVKEEAVDLTNVPDCSDKEIEPEESDIVKEEPIKHHQDLSRTEEEEKPVSTRMNFPELRVVLTRLSGTEDYVKSENIMDLMDLVDEEDAVKIEIKDEPNELENTDSTREGLADLRKEANVIIDDFLKSILDDREKKRNVDLVGALRPPRCSKGERNEMSWKKHSVKALRDAGQAYTSRANGKVVAARKIGRPCRDGCFDKITRPVIQELFDDFWGIGNFDKQNAYISPLVISKPVKRRRKTLGGKPSLRSQTLEYTVTYRNEVHKICKAAFLAIFGISEYRLRTALRKVTADGTTVPDMRGKHPPATKKDRRVWELIGAHVGSVPKLSSHYMRAKSPNHKYLASELNMRKLYYLYRSWMSKNYPSDEKVKESYHRIMVITCFNIGVAPVKMDICATCDLFKTQVLCKRAENAAQAELRKLESALEEHHSLAKQGQDLLTHFRRGKYDKPNTLALCFDFQRTLPTPKLSHSATHYKRKMWTYNFCVTNIKTNKSTMFIWHEVSGKRGSIEVASCLLKYLELHHNTEKETNLFLLSNNCASQNKNINLSLVLLRLIHERKFLEINHVYLSPCHSSMPSDRHFYNVELKLKKQAIIETKHDYIVLIKDAIRSGEVVEMDTKDFLDVDVLTKSIAERTPQKMNFSDARIIQYSSQYREGYSVKESYSDEEFKKVSLVKGRGEESTPEVFNLSNVTFRPKYSGPIRLGAGKVKHLKDLVPFISRKNRPYYKDILAQQEATARQGPDDSSDKEESDANDNLLEYE